VVGGVDRLPRSSRRELLAKAAGAASCGTAHGPAGVSECLENSVRLRAFALR